MSHASKVPHASKPAQRRHSPPPPTSRRPRVGPEPDDIGAVSCDLLRAVTHALQALAGDDDGVALRASVRRAARALRAERAFLARADAESRTLEVLVADGLSDQQTAALRHGRSSAGVSPSLVRAALTHGCAQMIEDSRLQQKLSAVTVSLSGDYSVLCVPICDPYTRAPLAVLYFQTSSLVAPLTPALVPHVEAYAVALGHTWHVWNRAREAGQPAPRRDEAESLGPEIIGRSRATLALLERLDRVVVPALAAPRPDCVLILGPTGAGKEVIARYIHAHSVRSKGRFVALNCAAFSGDVLEARLFGHVKGAFTGADSASDGLFVAADHGVLFLDELGDMPAQGQSLLLRALETRSVRALGARDERLVDVAVIAATNRDLALEVEAGRFRLDLYHRLKGLVVQVTALEARPSDVLPLLSHFLCLHERRLGKRTLGLAPEVLALLQSYPWPGNTRELSTVCSALVQLADPTTPIDEAVLADAAPDVLARARCSVQQAEPALLAQAAQGTLRQALAVFERAYILQSAHEHRWNKALMARQLGIDRKGLYQRLQRLGITHLSWDSVDEA